MPGALLLAELAAAAALAGGLVCAGAGRPVPHDPQKFAPGSSGIGLPQLVQYVAEGRGSTTGSSSHSSASLSLPSSRKIIFVLVGVPWLIRRFSAGGGAKRRIACFASWHVGCLASCFPERSACLVGGWLRVQGVLVAALPAKCCVRHLKGIAVATGEA